MSRAQKKRRHLIRNGGLDPSLKRGSWNGVKPIVRMTPTRQVRIRRRERKHKRLMYE
jgi:hypothetical protein